MGNAHSFSAEYQDAVAIFTDGEKEQIAAIFAGIKGPEKKRFNEEDFQSYCSGRLSPMLEQHLYRFMLSSVPCSECQKTVNSERFVVSLSHILKGSLDQHTMLVLSLINPDPDQRTKENLIKCLSDLLAIYPNTMLSKSELTSWSVKCPDESIQKLSQCMAKDLQAIEDEPLTLLQIEKWLSTCGLVTHVLESVFHHIFPVSYVESVDLLSSTKPLFPYTENVDWEEHSTILDIPSILLLSYSLPHELRSPWRLLFNSRKHGESFSTLLKFIKNKGPCLIVLRDTDGHVFGGFATESLTYRPQFVGNSYSFLFSLRPDMNIYTCTGQNENYLYCNHGQETMPNGLGFGGQLSYFGLWLDNDYGRGHSKATPTSCSTYGSPQLSAQEEFKFTHLEVWGLGEDPAKMKHGSDDEDGPGSILDKDPEAKAMLTLLDRGPHSEGLRDEDQLADTPGETQLKT